MDKQRWDDQIETIYNNSVPILKDFSGAMDYRGGWRRSGRSVLAVQNDDNDDVFVKHTNHFQSDLFYP